MTIIERAKALRAMIEGMAETLTDTAALEVPELFPKWKEGAEYKAGQRVRYNGIIYSVLTDHTAQADWTPEAASSLFAKVLTSDDGAVLPWVQPDSTNAYKTGDKVTHNGKTWESEVNGNVWEPGAYGWREVN